MKRNQLSPLLGPDGGPISRTITTTDVTVGGQTWTGGQAWLSYLSTPWYRKVTDDELKEPYKQHAWLRAVIDAKSRACKSVMPAIWNGKRGDTQNKTLNESHPWNALLERPNSICNGWQEFFETHIILKSLFGVSHIAAHDEAGKPVATAKARALVLLAPWATKPAFTKESKQFVGWTVEVEPNKFVFYPTESVASFRHPDPTNPLTGLPPWASVHVDLLADYAFSLANKDFGQAGFNLGGFVIGVGWTQDTAEKMRSLMRDKYAGSKHSGEYAVLSDAEDIKVIPNPATHRNAQFVEINELLRSKILAVYGIPESWVSLGSKLNNATSQSEDAHTWLTTINPELVDVEEWLWRDVFKAQSGGAVQTWVEFRRERVPALRQALRGNAIEEAHKLSTLGYPLNALNVALDLGLPTIPYLDVGYMNGAMRPVTLLREAQDVAKVPPEELAKIAAGEAAASEAEDTPADDAEDDTEDAARTAATPRSDEASRASLWHTVDRGVLTPNISTMKAAMLKFWKSQRKEVMSNFARVTRSIRASLTPDEIEEILFNLAEWDRKLLETATPVYRATMNAAVAQLREELGGLSGWNEQNPAITGLFQRRGAQLVEVNWTTRDMLKELLTEASEQNLGTQDIARLIQDVFAETGTAGGRARAFKIARTEVGSVAGQVRFEAMKSEGVSKHEWITSRGPTVSDGVNSQRNHKALDGQVRRIGENFANGFPAPHDPNMPPHEIIECNCFTQAVRDE